MTKTIQLIALSILLLSVLLSCQMEQGVDQAPFDQPTQETQAFDQESKQAQTEPETQNPEPETPKPETQRKLIREGRVEFETESIDSTRKNMYRVLEKYEAYLASDDTYNSPGRATNTVVIRVPAEHFDLLLAEILTGVGHLDHKQIEVKDVTSEYLDMAARIKTKKELEARYLALLKKANRVSEILEVEKQIGQLRAEIESIEGRLKYMQSRVSFSTLTLTFYEQVNNETRFGSKFKNGFRNGWDGLIWFLVALINIWPFIIIGVGLIFAIRFWQRKKK